MIRIKQRIQQYGDDKETGVNHDFSAHSIDNATLKSGTEARLDPGHVPQFQCSENEDLLREVNDMKEMLGKLAE